MFKQHLRPEDPAYDKRFVDMHVDRARRLLDTAQKTEPKHHMLNGGISNMSYLLKEHDKNPITRNWRNSDSDPGNQRMIQLFRACDKLAAAILYSIQGMTGTDPNDWECSELTGHDYTFGTIKDGRYRVCDRCGDLKLIPKGEREKMAAELE